MTNVRLLNALNVNLNVNVTAINQSENVHVNKPASKMTQKQSSTFNLWFLSDHWRSASSAARVPAVRVQEADKVVPVIICASEERVGATMATINSVHSNTDASVLFYIVTLRDAVKLTRFVACFQCKDYSFIRGVKMNRCESVISFKLKDTTTPICGPLDRSKCTGCRLQTLKSLWKK